MHLGRLLGQVKAVRGLLRITATRAQFGEQLTEQPFFLLSDLAAETLLQRVAQFGLLLELRDACCLVLGRGCFVAGTGQKIQAGAVHGRHLRVLGRVYLDGVQQVVLDFFNDQALVLLDRLSFLRRKCHSFFLQLRVCGLGTRWFLLVPV